MRSSLNIPVRPFASIVLIAIISASAACSNDEKKRDEWIKDAIYKNVTQGLTMDAMQRVDSITIVRVDSMTTKGRLLQLLEEEKATMIWMEKFYSTLTELAQADLDLVELASDEDERRKDLENLARDSADIKNSMEIMDQCSKRIDSLTSAHEQTEIGRHDGFDVEADIYYTFLKKAGKTRINCYVQGNGDLKAENLLLKQIQKESEREFLRKNGFLK